MYEKFYGIKEKTFNLNPDPDFFYMSTGHENAINHLEYSIAENKGITVITGEVGAGKTTIINYLLYHMQLDINIGLINNTNIAASQMMRVICNEFEVNVDNMDRTQLIDTFQQFLINKYGAGERVLLIIDEAQNLPIKTIEEIRMISNLETEKEHLIQMILVGQPELKAKLMKSELRQFAQRVAVYYHLNGLSRHEAGEYIRYRLKVGAAQDVDLFEDGAIDLLHDASRGIPRLINIICDSALVYGYADGLKKIDRDTIDAVLAERGLGNAFGGVGVVQPSALQSTSKEIQTESLSHSRLQDLENRILQLESTVSNIKEHNETLKGIQNKYDKVVVKLLDMLEKSYKSRLNLLDLIFKMQHPDSDQNPQSSQNIYKALRRVNAK